MDGMLNFLKNAANTVVTNVTQAAQQPIHIGDRTVVVKEQLGEGGFAYVSSVEDCATGELMAMKRMLCQDREARDIAEKEIQMLRQLKGHPNIINYIGSAKRDNTQSSHKATEYFVLMELCTGGSLIDLIRRRNGRKLGEIQVCELFIQICRGVQHMHSQQPPIAHRDLKIENVLIDDRGVLKLCDFGSCTTRAKAYMTSKEIVEEEEVISKYSTAMYRAPEMSDLYKRVMVNEKVDIWALGATLFTIAFFTQPFQDGGNLQILSGSYDVPEGHGFSNYLTALIKRLLTVDPAKRPDIGQVLALCAQWHRFLKGGGVAGAKPAPASRATSGDAARHAPAGPATAVTEPVQLHRHRSADEASMAMRRGAGAASASAAQPSEPHSAKPAKKSSKLPKEKKVRRSAVKEEADDSWADFGGFAAAAAPAPAPTPAPIAAPPAAASSPRRPARPSLAPPTVDSSDCSSTDEEDGPQPIGRPRAPSSYVRPPQAKAQAKPARPSGAAVAAAAASLSPKTAMLFDLDFAPSAAAQASAAGADADDDWAAFDSASRQQAAVPALAPSVAVPTFDFDFSGLSPPPPSNTAAANAASPSGRRSKKDASLDFGSLSMRAHTHT